MKYILIISKEYKIQDLIQEHFPYDHKVEQAETYDSAINILHRKRFEYIFVDLQILGESARNNGYHSILKNFWDLHPAVHIVAITPHEKIREAVKAVNAGCKDYITYPLDPKEIRDVIENINGSVIIKSEAEYQDDLFWDRDSLELIQTNNPFMKKIYDKIKSVSHTKSTVLLLGETGTGKGVLARLIHKHSNRKDAQFISVHCGAIPDSLLESELFGHEKGAFTGAVRRKLGKFEIAKGGTIFLDEIGTVTPSAQIKLLQVLQEGTFQRVGGEETIQADVRIVAATNEDLKKMCDDGLFRKDLYYRLNVFPIELLPLRERLDDIHYLTDYFFKKMNKFHAKGIHNIHSMVYEAFSQYDWPGNIRELENILERAYILETSSVLTPESFPNEFFDDFTPSACLPINPGWTLAEVRRQGIDNIERNYLKEQLAKNMGKINDTACAAGITTRQLHKLMTKYGIRKEEFKY